MKSLVVGLLMLANAAGASTFIGNGGSASDLEMQVALNQIKSIFERVQSLGKESDLPICRCRPRFDNQPSCEYIKKLDPDQVRYCHNSIKTLAPQVLDRLNGKKPLQINWTSNDITVKQSYGNRLSEAVTDESTSTITVNQDRFKAMNPPEQMFLLVHELFHLTKHENKNLTDEGAVGPFKGSDGARNFVNSMSAGAVMEGLDTGSINKYRSFLRRSSYQRKLWFDLYGEHMARAQNGTYAFGQMTGAKVGARYYLIENLGVGLDYWYAESTRRIRSSIDSKERMSAVTVSASYRLMPFSNPLTYFGQSHFVFNLGYQMLSAKYELKDPFVGIEEDVQANAVRFDVRYFLPIRWGLWCFVGVGTSTLKYEYTKLPLKYDSAPFYAFTGVSYGLF